MSTRADLLNSAADVQSPPGSASVATKQAMANDKAAANTGDSVAAARANQPAPLFRPHARSDTNSDDGDDDAGAAIISVAAAARLVDVHPATLRRWWVREIFPRPVKLGPNRIGFHRHEVAAWLASRPPVSNPRKAA